jgi:hypothetical protein
MAVLSPPDLGASVGLTFPTMYAGQRVYAREEVPQLPVADIPARVGEELRDLRLLPGARVAITAGSRGVANISIILKACGDAIRAAGGEPFVTPAMGSHGGATAEGQTEVLTGYGVLPETVGMPVVSSMDVRQIGTLDGDMPVFMSTVALDADHVLLVNRVKPHTDFRGRIESGLSKICAIGLGKQRGAQTIHSYGTRGLADLMPRAARCMIDTTGKVLGGLAILENAYDETAAVQWLPADAIGRGPEMELLKRGAKLMAGLPFDQIDVLVIDEMGKNISGAGMDTNVIGRMFVPGVTEFERPKITAIVVLDLTEPSHGNATGVGLADFTTERLVSQIDWQATYMNGYTSGIGGLMRNRLPNVLPNDREAVAAAIRMCGKPDPATARVVRIKNTLLAASVQLSESMLDDVEDAKVEITGKPERMGFDRDGRIN